MYPDFIGIGAQKAGTTWLARNLQAHPQIYMPRKELHYFDSKVKDSSKPIARLFSKEENHARWRRQVGYWTRKHLIKQPSLRDLAWDFKYYMRSYNDEWYASMFEEKNGKIAGEITPAYSILRKRKIAHVYDLMPEAKIIFMMRNPLERAWSQAVMNFDKAKKGSLEFASEEELLEKFERNSTRRLTNYLRTLKNWSKFYPEEQIFVGFLEDVHFFPEEMLRRIYEFLGVEPHFKPTLTNKKVHSRSADVMPTKVAMHLASDFREEIAKLGERFGGYASFWLHSADRLSNDPPEKESVPYPLWESEMWDEWTNAPDFSEAGAVRIQSGPLDSVQLTR